MNGMLGIVYITVYFVFGYLISVHNKWIRGVFGFGFPWMLTSIHLAIGGMGSWILHKIPDSSPPTKPRQSAGKWTLGLWIQMFWFSVLFTLNEAMGNMAVNRKSPVFNQLVWSAQPIVTAFLTFIAGYFSTGKPSPKRGISSMEISYYLSIVTVVAGLVISTIGDHFHYSHDPFFSSNNILLKSKSFTFACIFLSSIKGIWSKHIQTQLGISSMSFIWKISPLCIFLSLIPAYLSGEISGFVDFVQHRIHNQELMILVQLLIINAAIAFVLNWAGFKQATFFSSTTSAVLTNIKQGLASITLAFLSDSPIHPLSLIGNIIIFIGGLAYSLTSDKTTEIHPKQE